MGTLVCKRLKRRHRTNCFGDFGNHGPAIGRTLRIIILEDYFGPLRVFISQTIKTIFSFLCVLFDVYLRPGVNVSISLMTLGNLQDLLPYFLNNSQLRKFGAGTGAWAGRQSYFFSELKWYLPCILSHSCHWFHGWYWKRIRLSAS